MTWANILARGRGKARFRLVIAGCQYIFVTEADMEKSEGDGRSRVVGLKRKGLVVDQKVDLLKGLPSDAGMTVTIADSNGNASKAFGWLPSYVNYITGDETDVSTTINVASTSGATSGDHLHVATEAITTGTIGGTTFSSVTRGIWDTDAQYHYAADGQRLSAPVITNRPITMEGRRCWLYAYGDGDSPTGDGTEVWRGVCMSDSKRTGTGEWQITLGSRLRQLAQTLGGDLGEPVKPAGINYNARDALEIQVIVGSGTTHSTLASASEIAVCYVTGQFDTQEEFATSANASIANVLSALTNPPDAVRVVPDGPDGWHFEIDIDSSTPRYIGVKAMSPTDGYLDGTHINSLVDSITGTWVATVSGGESCIVKTYASTSWEPDGARSVPRGVFGITLPPIPQRFAVRTGGGDASSAIETYPTTPNNNFRIYVDGSVDLTNVDYCLIEWPAANGREALTMGGRINTSSSDPRFINISFTDTLPPEDQSRVYTRATLPTIKFYRHFATGDVSDFMAAVIADAAQYKNLASCPDISSNDINATDWTTLLGRPLADSGVLALRHYGAVSPVRFDKLLAAELRLAGHFLSLNAAGAMVPRPYRLPVATDPSVTAITSSQITVKPVRPTWEKHALGQAHSVKFRDGYSFYTDKFSTTHTIIDQAAFSKNPTAQEILIEPKSQHPRRRGEEAQTYNDIAALFAGLLGVVGHEYAIATVPIDARLHGVAMGDVVTITSPRIHDWSTGTLGVTAAPGLVIGRRFEYDTMRGALKVFLPGTNPAGYTPTAGITGQTDNGGDQWELTCRLGDPLALDTWGDTGESCADVFQDGDKVQVVSWNTASPTTVTGTINDISGNTIVVDFDATWTPSTTKWTLEFQRESALTASQLLFCVWANASIITQDNSANARRYSP